MYLHKVSCKKYEFLNDFNFCEIIINKFKTKQFHFSSVDYLTRGAVETAYIGIQKFY